MKKRNNKKVNLDLYPKLEKIDTNDDSKNGYNFVGSLNNWTSIEEQKLKVREIEEKTKGT